MIRQIVDARLAEQVKALREEGKLQEQIAAELRIAQSTVSIILRRGGLGGRIIGARRLQRVSINKPFPPGQAE